jgi:transglutaminase-like putative cysteine protease
LQKFDRRHNFERSLASHVLLKNHSVDSSSRAAARPVSRSELNYFLQPSRDVPTGGIVRDTAAKTTAGATSDVDKARAIYEWIVENTFRDPKVRGRGGGDVRIYARVWCRGDRASK